MDSKLFFFFHVFQPLQYWKILDYFVASSVIYAHFKEITESGLKKSAVQQSRRSRFSFWESNFSLTFAWWARD